MLPVRSRADRHLAQLRFRELRDEAARRRLAGEGPVVYRGRDWGVSRHQALTVLLGIGLLLLILLRPWPAQRPAMAGAPSSAVTLAAGESSRAVVPAVPPVPESER